MLPALQSQVRDQSYETLDNAALVRNYELGIPVRVFRGHTSKVKGVYPTYTYEGLYMVTKHDLVKSADGPLVSHTVLCCAVLCRVDPDLAPITGCTCRG